MKEWTKPVVDELNVTETQYGGDVQKVYDDVYQDENKAWHVTYPNGENES